MTLLLASALLALSAPAAAPSTHDNDAAEIVVRGQRSSEARVRQFVDALTPSRIDGQIVRFGQEICPSVIGLAERQNVAVAARLRRIAKAAGAPLGALGCRPNLFVVVAEDRAAMVRTIQASWRTPVGDRVRPASANEAATVMHMEGVLDGNGQLAGVRPETGDGPGGYYELEVFGSPRIRPSSSPTFLASVMVVEPAAIEGLTTLQLADHAAMRLLARTDPTRLGPGSPLSILSALSAPIGSPVPLTLTSWDLAFLKALYASEGRTYAGSQRREIGEKVAREVAPPAPKP
jgi:hypothetical protein